MTDRVSKGVAIALGGGIVPGPDGSFLVPSASVPGKFYEVRIVRKKWVCTCPDFQNRDVKCKHIVAVTRQLVSTYLEEGSGPIDERKACPKCHLTDQVRDNGHDKKGKQLNYCKRCDKYFRKPSLVRGAHFDPEFIVAALDLYYTSSSYRQSSQYLYRQTGTYVSHQSIGKWNKKWIPELERFIDMIPPKLSGIWSVDEMMEKVKGGFTLMGAPGMYKFRWNSMDVGTKLYLATLLTTTRQVPISADFMRKSLAAAKEDPRAIVTDKHGTYPGGIAQAFKLAPQMPVHVRVLSGAAQRRGNQAVERLNNTVRSRSKTMRGLKSPDSPIPSGEVLHYNQVRPNMSLDGLTPGEKAGMGELAPGPNKLLSLMENAVGFRDWMTTFFPNAGW